MDEKQIEPGQPAASDSGSGKKHFIIILLIIIAVAGGTGLYKYLQFMKTHISTDDAYVAGTVYEIAPKVAGTASQVLVDDNTQVKKGDLLVVIEPQDYQAQLQLQESGLSLERAKLTEVSAGTDTARRKLAEFTEAVNSARAALKLREATAAQAKRDADRAAALVAKGFIAREQFEQTDTASRLAAEAVDAASKELSRAQAAVETQRAVIRQSETAVQPQRSAIGKQEASLAAARLAYGYTKIYSPADGFVTKKAVDAGEQLRVGQPIMAVTALGDTWIIANYKETQLTDVRPGQKVDIKIDSYPNQTFHGHVDSIMAGTGSAFSLFPPENATGNFVKIVQRVPVKIILEPGADKSMLRIGMSVVPTILVK